MIVKNEDYREYLREGHIKYDIVITDPPYLYEKGGNSKMLGKGEALLRERRTMQNSEFGKEEIYEFLNLTEQHMEKPQWFIFCSEKQLPFYLAWATERKYQFNILVWCKPLSVLNKNRFSTNCEYICRIYNWGSPLNRMDETKNLYYSKWKVYPLVSKKEKIHPQQKPIGLIKELIEIATAPKDVVFDPFAGSGTILKAAIELGRMAIGTEKDACRYADMKDRLEQIQITIEEKGWT